MPPPKALDGLVPGAQLYKYELLHRIGRGSFGEVWLAHDQAVNSSYAVKILDQGTPIDERLREAQIGHQLVSDNLVRVHHADVIEHGSKQYMLLAMDYIEGGSIINLANQAGYLKLPDVIRLGRDILRGLEYLHRLALIHNDIKPGNVLIGPQGRGMLTDYGIAGVSQSGAPTTVSAFYKLHAAPEVVASDLFSPQSDIYQVGLTLFRMLVGLDAVRRKFRDLGEQGFYNAAAGSGLVQARDFPAYVPARLRRLVIKASDPDPSRRFTAANGMRTELERLDYPGYWTVDLGGNPVGRNGAYSYRVNKQRAGARRFNVQATRRSESTGRETRCRSYCHTDVTGSAADTAVQRFVRAVVEGM